MLETNKTSTLGERDNAAVGFLPENFDRVD